ncbi:unnamed protein product [Cyprideis torosa]|uniref:glutathione transferase n=1 Tax=Cyprideis torosa TaxID=163714 RepID=A0A7R8WBV2_9CRUS|nr:unnamed protein product [Cyprideis torosa]CAG0886732.1 unnamed protein product [Cyprideis torosa]
MAPILAYWDIRGLAQPIRLLLHYTETEFEDKYYVCGPAPTYDKSCWFSVKDSLGLDFPNLPYYIEGDIKITQSNAIMRFVARKGENLEGKTPKEKVRVDMLENESMDFRNGFVRLCYMSKDYHRVFHSECLNNFKNLKDLLDRFEAIPQIKKYMESDKFIADRINNRMAHFGA